MIRVDCLNLNQAFHLHIHCGLEDAGQKVRPFESPLKRGEENAGNQGTLTQLGLAVNHFVVDVVPR